LAAVFHALFVLLVLLALAPLLGYLPMAALAALLLLVAWNMSELKHFRHIFQVAPGSDILVLLVCFGLTVIFDMVIAISVGVVLAALLFMNRMAELDRRQACGGRSSPSGKSIAGRGALVRSVSGSLFFGAAEKAMSALHDIGARPASGHHRYRRGDGHGCVGAGGAGFRHRTVAERWRSGRGGGGAWSTGAVDAPGRLRNIPGNCCCRPVCRSTGGCGIIWASRPRGKPC
jgi:hypothetical protein